VREIKRRRLIISLVLLLCVIYFSASFVFGELGLLKYLNLQKKKAFIETQITEIQKENEQTRAENKLFREDPFYSEKYAREHYNLARPEDLQWIYKE
jgi:cell division protein FtsB